MLISDSSISKVLEDNSDSGNIGEREITSENKPVDEVSPDDSSAEDVEEGMMDGYRMITWWDLLSEPEIAYYKEQDINYEADPSYSPTTDPPAIGINPGIDGLKICIPGFVVGVDSDPDNFSKINTFLFVPYQGACIHVPPPPSNETIFATVNESFESNPYIPYWLFGSIYTENGNNKIANYSYTLKGDKLKIYKK